MHVEEIIYPAGTRGLSWRLDEETTRLLDLCREAGIPVDDLSDMPVKWQREQLAERLLLHCAFGKPVTLLHDGQGAPWIKGVKVNISITHTQGLVALAWNERHVIGLDAERCDRRQVLRVRSKFLNASEQQFIVSEDLAAHIIAWTAKEAVIKAERNSAIDWTDGIKLEPFASEAVEIGFTAHCGHHDYRITSRRLEEYYMTVAEPIND